MLTRIHKVVVITTFLIASSIAAATSAWAQDRADFSFRAIDGATVTSESLRGQVVVLAFGASWLPLTRNQMEGVKALKAALGDYFAKSRSDSKLADEIVKRIHDPREWRVATSDEDA